jgi:hypothetical protein
MRGIRNSWAEVVENALERNNWNQAAAADFADSPPPLFTGWKMRITLPEKKSCREMLLLACLRNSRLCKGFKNCLGG